MSWSQITSDEKQIEYALKLIKDHTGLKLKLCDHFTGINTYNERRYFNVILSERISESLEYALLCSFANKYKLISVEPNGVKRIAVYLNE